MKLNMKIILVFLAIITITLTGCSLGGNNRDSSDNSNDNQDISFADKINDDPSKIVIYYFYGDTCPACAQQTPYLEELAEMYDEVELKKFEVYRNPENARLFQKVAQAYGARSSGVPTTFISERYWIGATQAMGAYVEELLQRDEWINPSEKIE